MFQRCRHGARRCVRGGTQARGRARIPCTRTECSVRGALARLGWRRRAVARSPASTDGCGVGCYPGQRAAARERARTHHCARPWPGTAQAATQREHTRRRKRLRISQQRCAAAHRWDRGPALAARRAAPQNTHRAGCRPASGCAPARHRQAALRDRRRRLPHRTTAPQPPPRGPAPKAAAYPSPAACSATPQQPRRRPGVRAARARGVDNSESSAQNRRDTPAGGGTPCTAAVRLRRGAGGRTVVLARLQVQRCGFAQRCSSASAGCHPAPNTARIIEAR
jgi:hypothetical protein